MGSPDAITGKCKVIFTICILLLASLPTSALLFSFKVSAQEESSIREPTKLYVGAHGCWFRLDPGWEDAPMVVWNITKQLGELADLSNYGEYSVFISEHIFSINEWGDAGNVEWFVAASSLQPDNNGIVHQLVLRFQRACDPYSQLISFPLLKSYAENYSFNPTSIEDGKSIIRAFLANESIDPSVLSDADFLINYPFLTVLPISPHWGGQVRATIILNLCTGKVMLAAMSDLSPNLCPESRMLYPDRQPPPGAGITFDPGMMPPAPPNIIGYRLGDSANGMLCISCGTCYPGNWGPTQDFPWNYVLITEVCVNGTKVENTSPQLPLTIPPGDKSIALNVTMMVNPGDSFVVTLVSSKGENFTSELDVPIPPASGDPAQIPEFQTTSTQILVLLLLLSALTLLLFKKYRGKNPLARVALNIAGCPNRILCEISKKRAFF